MTVRVAYFVLCGCGKEGYIVYIGGRSRLFATKRGGRETLTLLAASQKIIFEDKLALLKELDECLLPEAQETLEAVLRETRELGGGPDSNIALRGIRGNNPVKNHLPKATLT